MNPLWGWIAAESHDRIGVAVAASGGKTIIVIGHDLAELRALAPRLVVMHRGAVVADGELSKGDLAQYGISCRSPFNQEKCFKSISLKITVAPPPKKSWLFWKEGTNDSGYFLWTILSCRFSLHRMDPRAKITSLFLLYIGVFFFDRGISYGSHLPFVLDLWPILGFRPKFIGAVPV